MANASGQQIRLLIVDDDAEMRENLKKLMTLESDIDVIGVATGGREGVQMALELKPDVVTMDINMGDIDGLQAATQIMARYKRVAIIMLSVQHDLHYYRSAMQSGACDFLTKPPEPDELFNAIRRCYEALPSEQAAAAAGPMYDTPTPTQTDEGQVLTVYGPKGGVGTTTLATSLAIGLARRQGRVCLIDADLQFGDVGIFLNMRMPNSIVDLTQETEDFDLETVDMVLGRHDSGARILLGSPRPELAEYVLPSNVKRMLQFFRQHFEYIIVDTATAVNETMLALLDETDKLITLTSPDIPGLKNASVFYELLDLLHFDTNRTWFVVNRLLRGSQITAERIEQRLSRQVVGRIPDDPQYALLAANSGEALIDQDRGKSPAAGGLLEFVKFVESTLKEEKAETETDGDRLTSLF